MKSLSKLTAKDKKEIMEKVYQKFKYRTLHIEENVQNVDPVQRCTHTELRNYIEEKGYNSNPIDSYPIFKGYISKCIKRFKKEFPETHKQYYLKIRGKF